MSRDSTRARVQAPALQRKLTRLATQRHHTAVSPVIRLHARQSASSLHHFVSVMPIPRVEFKLRRETVYLLERCSVDTSDLVFADELDLAALHEALPSPDRLQLVLTDHNQVASKYAFLNEAVTEIVDHHQDAGAHPWVTGDARHIAFNTAERKGVGSACTLVAQKFESVAPDLLTPDVAAALLGVVLIDTSNLSEKAKKATPADHEAVALLDGKTPGVDKDELFTALQGEKFNPDFWASLSVGECLAYDYKVFTSAAAEAGAASTAAAALETGGPGADAAASGLGSDVTYGTSSVLVPLRGELRACDGCDTCDRGVVSMVCRLSL